MQKRLKPTAVPHIFPWKEPLTPTVLRRKERGARRTAAKKSLSFQQTQEPMPIDMEVGAEETCKFIYLFTRHVNMMLNYRLTY